MEDHESQVFRRMTDLALIKIRELPGANFDNIRNADGDVLLTEVPGAIELAEKNHFELIDILRKCPRSKYFASSTDALNVNTLKLNDVLTEIRSMTATKADDEGLLESINEGSES